MEIITERDQFVEFARKHGLRMNWHEPDEQDITARVAGVAFDNAGFWPAQHGNSTESVELHVIFAKQPWSDEECPCGDVHRLAGEDLAAVNLATLCAWATGYGSTPQP